MDLLKRYYKNLISAFILIAGIVYLAGESQAYHVLQLDPKVALVIIILHGLFYFLATVPQFYILNKLKIRIKLTELFSITIMTNFLNLLLPARGGVLLRGVILNRKYSMKKRDYAAFSAFISMAGLFVLGVMGLFFFPYMYWDYPISPYLLQLGALALMFFSFTGLYSTKLLAKWSPKVAVIYNEKTNWKKINKKDNFFVTSLMYGLSLCSYAIRIYLLSVYFYLDVDLLDAGAIAVLMLLINTFPILPGNIGIKEASLSGILALMGHNPQIGFFIAIIDRLTELIILALFGLIFSFKWNIWAEWEKRDTSGEEA